MSEIAEKEAANWTKGSTALIITKNGLALAIIEILKEWLKNFRPELFDHLPQFLENILEKESVDVKYITGGSNPWTVTGKCPCGMRLCQEILNELCDKQVNKSKNVVWRPHTEESKLRARRRTRPYSTWLYEICYICREYNCPFQSNRKGVSLFEDELSKEIVNIYWPFANMFMFRGNEKNDFPNTRPEDTDVALIFKLMKNCSLFSISEDDVDNGIYDALLEMRNCLMHSPDNRLSDDALDECFGRMVTILNAKKFSNVYSGKAIKELEMLKDMRIIMATLTSEEASIVKQAFELQQSALKLEINLTGMLKNNYVLKEILKASEAKGEQYVGNAETNDIKLKTVQRVGYAALVGAMAGAIVGALAGPMGAGAGACIGFMSGFGISICCCKSC